MKEIKGKNAVVVGAASGIGRSIVLELAKEGANVAVVDIDIDLASKVAEEAKEFGVDSFAMRADVSKREDLVAVADAAYERFGTVEILVNNAGVTLRPFRAHWDASYEDYQWMMNINYWGVVHGHLAFVPRMLKTPGEKHIVNTSSLASLYDVAGHGIYSASKAAVDGFSNSAREELKHFDIGLTILHPGMVRTRIGTSERLMDDDHKSQQSKVKAWAEYIGNDKVAAPAMKVGYVAEEKDADVPTQAIQYITPKYVGMFVVEAIRKNRPHVTTHPLVDAIQKRIDDINDMIPTYPEV